MFINSINSRHQYFYCNFLLLKLVILEYKKSLISYMQHVTQIILCIILNVQSVYCQNSNTLIEIDSFGANPGNLKMYVHNQVVQQTIKVPLVIVLHGCGQNAKNAAALSGWNKLADSNHFVVVYPQQKFLNNPNLCFNWFKSNDIEKGKGEDESIYQMIVFAKQHYNIDTTNIFITGFSAGAAMGVVMAATHPELFKGAAIFAGGAYKIATNPINGLKAMLGKINLPKEKLINNMVEQNINYKGQYPTLIIYQGVQDAIVNNKNAQVLINQWTGINNTDTIPDKMEYAFMGVADITRSEYTNSLGKTIVIFYQVNNLGHQLMVMPGQKENEGGQTGLFSVNKGFHSTYQTAKEFGIINKK